MYVPFLRCPCALPLTAATGPLPRRFLLPCLPQKDLAELAAHKYGYRVICQLLHPDCGRYLPPQLLAIARPPTKEYSAEAMQRQLHTVVAEAQEQKQEAAAAAADSDGDDEEGGGGGGARPTSGPLGISKKDPSVRRRELLGSGPASLAGALGALCTGAAPALIRSQHGSEVLVEVCRGGEGGLLAECLEEGDPAALPAVHDALVAAVAGGEQGSGSGDEAEGAAEGAAAAPEDPVLSNFFGSRALRRLVLASGDGGPSGAAAAAFTQKLWSGALQGRCTQWVDSHAAKVLAALLQCGDAAVKKEAAAELRPLVKGSSSLEEWSARLTAKQPQQKPQQKKQPQQQKPQQQKKQPAAAAAAPAASGRQRQPAAAAAGGAASAVKKQPQRAAKKK
jgi:pumilio family protein 6